MTERWAERPVTKFERKGLEADRSITDLSVRPHLTGADETAPMTEQPLPPSSRPAASLAARPAAGYAPPPPVHPQAITVLVLGIVAIVVCQVVGPFAWRWATGSSPRSQPPAGGRRRDGGEHRADPRHRGHGAAGVWWW